MYQLCGILQQDIEELIQDVMETDNGMEKIIAFCGTKMEDGAKQPIQELLN